MVALKLSELILKSGGENQEAQVSTDGNDRTEREGRSEEDQSNIKAKEDDEDEDIEKLIPGLPRSLALQCMARVPRQHHHTLIRVSRAWRGAFLGGDIYRMRQALRLQEPWIYLVFCRKQAATCTADVAANVDQRDASSGCWLEAYDPRFNTWHQLGPIPGLPASHALKGFGFAALGETLYIIGGRLCTTQGGGGWPGAASPAWGAHVEGYGGAPDADLEVRREVLAYHTTARRWSRCASMAAPRAHFASSVCRGRIYAAGGRSRALREKGVSSAEAYVAGQDTWQPLPPMSTGRYKCVGVTCGDRVHIVGGFAGPDSDSDTIQPFNIDRSCVDVYQPSKGEWALIKGMWQLDVPPNQIVTVGGRLYSSGDALNMWKGRIEQYDEALNMWKIVDGSWLPMTHPEEARDSAVVERCYLTMAPIGHRLYFMGGYRLLSNPHSSLHTIYIFDTTTLEPASQWQMAEPVEDICKDLCSHCCVVTF